MLPRECLPNRRASTTFDFEVAGLHYTATFARFADGRLGESLPLITRPTAPPTSNARDAAIAFSVAVQHGADPEVIRRALCRDFDGKASGPLGAALDIIAQRTRDGHDGHPPRLHRATPEIPA